MKKSAVLWLLAAIAMFMIAGVTGDMIFQPHPQDFSFTVFSNYINCVILLITAGVCWNSDKP